LTEALLNAYLFSGDAISPVERARFDTLRGRLARKRGDLAEAEAHYRLVRRRAATLGVPELQVRADIGFAVLARLRGNIPASREAGARAAATADKHRLFRLAALAHHTLMVAAASAEDWDGAIAHAWHSYRYVSGDSIAEAAQLADLAQLFYDMGHFDIAAAGFAVALTRPMPRHLLLPALGGAALAAARLGRRAAVEEYGTQAREYGNNATFSYAVAACWLEIAEAFLLLGHREDADGFRLSALQIASMSGYHELAYRAEHLHLRDGHAPSQPTAISAESWEIGYAMQNLAAAL
jgi:hypothetical protein